MTWLPKSSHVFAEKKPKSPSRHTPYGYQGDTFLRVYQVIAVPCPLETLAFFVVVRAHEYVHVERSVVVICFLL